MCENAGYLEIIKQAQLGSRDNMSRLAEEARGKVFVYIYRVTLDYHLAQDLSQDTVLEMIKSLKSSLYFPSIHFASDKAMSSACRRKGK